jgi:hypothetical protein
MQETMLNYCKTLLEKVSFDHMLLNKEYRKCMEYLNAGEKEKFEAWISCQDFSQRIRSKQNPLKKENATF